MGSGKRSLGAAFVVGAPLHQDRVIDCQMGVSEGFNQQSGGIGVRVLSLLFGLVLVVAVLVLLWRRSARAVRKTSAIGRNACMGGEEDS